MRQVHSPSDPAHQRQTPNTSEQSYSAAALSTDTRRTDLSLVRFPSTQQLSTGRQLEEVQRAFERYSGAKLVFNRNDLAGSGYFDSLPPLSNDRKLRAAQIALEEIKKYPPQYLRNIGLETVGVFDACVSRQNDGYHSHSARYGGYLYYGCSNLQNGVVGAYYSDRQLPLTLHHEIFHHTDATRNGSTDSRYFTGDDNRFANAVSGRQPYGALPVSAADLRALKAIAGNSVLSGAVSDYVTKSTGEDEAETARYFMSHMPEALVQAAERPNLPGSQRILHVINRYGQANPEISAQWFVDCALGRNNSSVPVAVNPPSNEPAGATRDFAGTLGTTERQMRARIQSDDGRFKINGQEDENGINWTLRKDVGEMASIAQQLGGLATKDPAKGKEAAEAIARSLNLLGSYHEHIKQNWSISPGTEAAFEKARVQMVGAIPDSEQQLKQKLTGAGFADLAGAKASEPTNEPDPKIVAALTAAERQMRGRIEREDGRFTINGREDGNGVNWTLRDDLAQFGSGAEQLARLAGSNRSCEKQAAEAIARNMATLGAYHEYIKQNWSISPGTEAAFEKARSQMADAIPAAAGELKQKLAGAGFAELAAGRRGPAVPDRSEYQPGLSPRNNSYLHKVREALGNNTAARNIELVQPACVAVACGGGNASGVNLSPNGMILTNAHVAKQLGRATTVQFPDGSKYSGVCVSIDHNRDLALVQLKSAQNLPYAPLADKPAGVGSSVTCIGQPGGYDRWHVSTGAIKEYKPTHPWGEGNFGQMVHSAWTYWGNSGSPLFNDSGEIVGIHNTWDGNRGKRHGIPLWEVTAFLRDSRLAT